MHVEKTELAFTRPAAERAAVGRSWYEVMTVHILIGRVGAGKTAFARAQEHERNAVRFSLDDWMTHLYGHHMPRDLFDSRVQLCMDLILDLTERLAALGVEVVLDCGFWKRKTRQDVWDRFTRSGTTVQAWYFDTPAHIRWSRLEKPQPLFACGHI